MGLARSDEGDGSIIPLTPSPRPHWRPPLLCLHIPSTPSPSSSQQHQRNRIIMPPHAGNHYPCRSILMDERQQHHKNAADDGAAEHIYSDEDSDQDVYRPFVNTKTSSDEDDDDVEESIVKGGSNSNANKSDHQNNMMVLVLAATYFCSSFSLALPFGLLPLMGHEFAAAAAATVSNDDAISFTETAFLPSVAALSTLGGGCGKLVNGFVCQRCGARRSSTMYLILAAGGNFAVSVNKNAHWTGHWLAGLEFCASMQWTALLVILANHFEKTPVRFASTITLLSLASTLGTLTAQMGGSVLLHYTTWRTVARLGAVVALLGAALVSTSVAERPSISVKQPTSPITQTDARRSSRLRRPPARDQEKVGETAASSSSALHSMRAVAGSSVFWLVATTHATSMLARTSDRVLGGFFQFSSGLPHQWCGALTAAVTMGFVHGLAQGRLFFTLPDLRAKLRFVRGAYTRAVLAVLGLILCAHSSSAPVLVTHVPYAGAAVLAGLVGTMASSLSFQFYHIPPLVATTMFGPHKAVCLSLLDAVGFFFASRVWALTGALVHWSPTLGWSMSFGVLAVLYTMGGMLLVRTLPQVLRQQQEALAISSGMQ